MRFSPPSVRVSGSLSIMAPAVPTVRSLRRTIARVPQAIVPCGNSYSCGRHYSCGPHVCSWSMSRVVCANNLPVGGLHRNCSTPETVYIISALCNLSSTLAIFVIRCWGCVCCRRHVSVSYDNYGARRSVSPGPARCWRKGVSLVANPRGIEQCLGSFESRMNALLLPRGLQ